MFEVEKDVFHVYINKEYTNIVSDVVKRHFDFKVSFLKLVKFALLECKQNLRLSKKSFKKNSGVNYSKIHSKKKYWFFINTQNNFLTVDFVYKELQQQSIYVSYQGAEFVEDKLDLRSYYKPKPTWRKIFFVFYLFFNKRYTSVAYNFISRYFHLYAFYGEVLKNCAPEAIFFSNDHYPGARALMLAANKENIKTIYLPHASVSKLFPPLKFSLSILESEFSKKVYQTIGEIKGETAVVGVFRLKSSEEELVVSKTINRVGIAFNMRDELEIVEQLIHKLSIKYPEKIFIARKHPQDKRISSKTFNKNVLYSDARNESSLIYLKGIDVIIANNSTILLEAAVLNVYPIQFNFSDKMQSDYYGYIENGVADEVETITDLYNILNGTRNTGLYYRNRAKYYDASIGTEDEFDIQKKIIAIVKQYLSAASVLTHIN